MTRERGPRWLLFGANGLVGSHLRAALAGRDVVPTVHRTDVPGAVRVDLTDESSLRHVVLDARANVVVMAAGDAFVERCEREPAATRAVNVDAVRTVAEAAPDALLVVFSSEYVFDGGAGPYAEDDAVTPLNEYGRQKVEVERIARVRPRHLVLRVSGVYGWSPARTSFVAQLVDALRAGRRFSVASDQVITPTPAADLARAVVDLVDGGASGTIHAAGPLVLPRHVFATLAATVFGLDPGLLDAVPTDALKLAAPRPRGAGLRTDRLRALLGRGLAPPSEGLATMRAAEPLR